MRVLVACEFSGIVRDAFAARGHDAWSCDLLPTERPGNHHQGDVLEILNEGWDLMIAHPPCTYLSYAGTAWWNDVGRCKHRLDALEFFRLLWEANIERICIENPRGCASPTIAKYTQIIHPYYFGDNAKKATCLWLKNLPPLLHIKKQDLFADKTHIREPEPIFVTRNGKKVNYSDSLSPSKDRQKNRSRFWPGIAGAMAEQWG